MPLRNFLYLDVEAVDGYLSQVEGALVECSYTTKTQTSGGKEGSIGAGIKLPVGEMGAGGRAGSTRFHEEDRTLRETPETRFSRLRKLLTSPDVDEDERLQVINAADTATFKQIDVGEIIEVRGVGRLPRWEHLRQDFAQVQAFGKLVEAFGVDVQGDPVYSNMKGQMDALSDPDYDQETILIVVPHGAPSFTIFTKLFATNRRRDKMMLENEVTIVGKVIRQLAAGQKQDIVHLAPRLETMYNLAKKTQPKGPRGKIERPKTDTPLDEAIKYPALELSTIAVFQ